MLISIYMSFFLYKTASFYVLKMEDNGVPKNKRHFKENHARINEKYTYKLFCVPFQYVKSKHFERCSSILHLFYTDEKKKNVINYCIAYIFKINNEIRFNCNFIGFLTEIGKLTTKFSLFMWEIKYWSCAYFLLCFWKIK